MLVLFPTGVDKMSSKGENAKPQKSTLTNNPSTQTPPLLPLSTRSTFRVLPVFYRVLLVFYQSTPPGRFRSPVARPPPLDASVGGGGNPGGAAACALPLPPPAAGGT